VARVIALVDDLFFQAKLAETARQVGVELKVVMTAEALSEEANNGAGLVVLDLNAKTDAIAAIAKLREAGNAAPVIGFLSHVQTELAERARAAGCCEVMPRSKCMQNLAAIFSMVKG
jgi:DNA-binding NarL/FixJ family response regulator